MKRLTSSGSAENTNEKNVSLSVQHFEQTIVGLVVLGSLCSWRFVVGTGKFVVWLFGCISSRIRYIEAFNWFRKRRKYKNIYRVTKCAAFPPQIFILVVLGSLK